MAVASTRKVVIVYSGDFAASFAFSAASNSASPADIDILSLAAGNNTIMLPTGGSSVKGATIIPPSDNLQTITLKGVNGDTGIALHKTDPASISFDTVPPASFVLNAGGIVTGLRILWS